MKLLITIALILGTTNAMANRPELRDFKHQGFDAPIAQWLIATAKQTNKYSTDCAKRDFTSAIHGNLRAIYSTDDYCDGGNSFGIVFDISNLQLVYIIDDTVLYTPSEFKKLEQLKLNQ